MWRSSSRMRWMGKGSDMEASDRLFLSVLSSAVHEKEYDFPADEASWRRAVHLAQKHSVLPMFMDAVWQSVDEQYSKPYRSYAKRRTCLQAQRTADFLLLYAFLAERGLQPVVMKGITLRALYPHPEQRASVDEDLIIRPEEFPEYHRALLDYGLQPVLPAGNVDSVSEVSYEDKGKGLYIELHKRFFPDESAVFADLNDLFAGALNRSEYIDIYGQKIAVLAPTDHLLYMLCHIYKHFLHGGFGIRLACDIGVFSEKYGERIDWKYIFENCELAHIEYLTAGIYRILERYLGFPVTDAFADLEVEGSDLLTDILTGGLYGMDDINRAHSSTITLDAVAKQKRGKKGAGLFAAVFLPLSSMNGKYPYLRKYPWLLPVAWTQRVAQYLTHREKSVDPTESIRIGNQRLKLLQKYEIIE